MTVKHRQLASTVGRVSDDLSTNSMASSNFNNILEKDTILSFEIWICIADGSGGFTSHIADPKDAGSHHADEDLAQIQQHKLPLCKTLLKISRRKKILI